MNGDRPSIVGIADTPGQSRISSTAAAWARDVRKIDIQTLESLGVASGTTFFPDLGRKSEALFFKYAEGWKARAIPEKSFVAGKGLKLSFWNIETIIAANPPEVFLTEGELDACALVESGISPDRVLSVPNGAKERAADAPLNQRGYEYVKEALVAGLNRCKRFVWCGDSDGPGLSLRADMVRLLGAARFWFVEWPEGCKDANDMLRTDTAEALREFVCEGALPWPINGLYRLSELPEPAPLTLWRPGFPEWESKIMLAPRTLSVVTGHPGHGKALAIDTPIPTPNGWAKIGELKCGDSVFDERGDACTIIAATPIFSGEECFKIKFNDGSEFIADGNHEWLTESNAARLSERAWRRRGGRSFTLPRGTDQSHKRVRPSVVSTKSISQSLVAGGKNNHAIRLSAPIKCKAEKLSIPPYTFGAWLGDGDSIHSVITCHIKDIEIINNIIMDGVPVKKTTGNRGTFRWSLSDGIKSPRKDSILGRLRGLGVLGNKHIPVKYKRTSYAQRLALLQGLMDTDGYVGNGIAEFCNMNKRLADDVYELICSLGISARMTIGRATLKGRDCGEKYRIFFASVIPVFRLTRKLNVNKKFVGRKKYRYIVACDKIDSVPVRCIQVDSPSNLYLAGRSFVPTHNSILWGQIWFQVSMAYGVMPAIASFETRPKPHIRRQFRTLLSGKLERDMNDEEKHKADEWINERYLFIVHPEQRPTLEWFLDMAEVAVIRHGARIIQIDPWNRLEDQRGGDETKTDYIGRCLKALHVFAHDMNCHVQIIAHPAKMDGGRRGNPPTLEDISDCYSDDTDVLTKRGWILHQEVKLTDQVACFDLENSTLRWEFPQKIKKFEYDGMMAYFNGPSMNMLLTPNHRMVVKPAWKNPTNTGLGRKEKWKKNKWQFFRASELTKTARLKIPLSAQMIGGDEPETIDLDGKYPIVPFLRFLGWWLAEGWVACKSIAICQQPGELQEYMAHTMRSDLGLSISETIQNYPNNPNYAPTWRAYIHKRKNPQIVEWMIANCGAGAANKKMPDIIWDLSVRLKRIVLDAVIDGDGYRPEKRPMTSCVVTTSPYLRDAVQRLAVECGLPCSVGKKRKVKDHHSWSWNINIGEPSRKELTMRPDRHLNWIPYIGDVWCLRVPTGAYVTRRNGRIAFQGNSKNWDNMVDQGFVIHRPELFDGATRKTEAVLYHRKARFDELGHPCKLWLDYDLNLGKFKSMDYGK